MAESRGGWERGGWERPWAGLSALLPAPVHTAWGGEPFSGQAPQVGLTNIAPQPLLTTTS